MLARDIPPNNTMIEKGINGGHRGRGYTGCGCVCSRGHNYSGTKIAPTKGLCTDLGRNVFDFGYKALPDKMRTSREKLVQHVGTKYGQDISNDLNNKLKVNIVIQVHSNDVLVGHATREALVYTFQSNIQLDCQAQASMLRSASTADPSDVELPTKIAVMNSDISKGDYDIANKIPIEMSDSEKTAYGNEWRT